MKTSSKIHFVYFACRKHFEHLYLSLRSLRVLRFEGLGKVYLYIDKDDFLSEGQIIRLKKLGFDLLIRKSAGITWRTNETILGEVRIFLEIGREIDPEDYLAKVDSDILFLSKDIFRKVLISNKDAVGDPTAYHEPFVYFAGGLYFIKASLVPVFEKFSPEIIDDTLNLVNNETARGRNRICKDCPEDAAIYNHISKHTSNTGFEKFTLYSWNRLKDPIDKYSVIHFQRCRGAMKRFWYFEYLLLRSGKAGVIALTMIRKTLNYAKKLSSKYAK